MGRNILLIEPNYKNKYPPIGLMKISTYHKMLGDKVKYFKGNLRELEIDLKYKTALKRLSRIDKRIIWQKQENQIKKFLTTNKLSDFIHLSKCYSDRLHDRLLVTLKGVFKEPTVAYWDRIYIATLFTFYWDVTIKTIEFSKRLVTSDKIYVGGVMATLLKDEIAAATGIIPISGLLDRPGSLDPGNSIIIDELPLDYSILEEILYQYPTQSAYFTYMTKGCTRKCAFCSVPKLEPSYKEKIPAVEKFKQVNDMFGEQRNLLLMDNNVLASPKFPEIIEEIRQMGFTKGAKFEEPNYLDIAIKNIRSNNNRDVYITKAAKLMRELSKRLDGKDAILYNRLLKQYKIYGEKVSKTSVLKAYGKVKLIYERARYKGKCDRYVDFNQGTDARYVNEENMRLMSSIPIKPLRIAFDHIGIKNTYINAVELAAKYGINDLSNYILYNFHDRPEDFYERLKINVELGKRLNIKIFSFPMKYIPLLGEEAKHRRYIGMHWNRKFIRAIQCILNATKGIVAPGYDFFYMAFGHTLETFLEILWMPETYIINRNYFERNGMTNNWRSDFQALNQGEIVEARKIISENDFVDNRTRTNNPRILRLLTHYNFVKHDKEVVGAEVKKLREKYNRLIKKDQFINLTLTHDFDSKYKNRLAV